MWYYIHICDSIYKYVIVYITYIYIYISCIIYIITCIYICKYLI